MNRLEEIENRLKALPAPHWEAEDGEILRRWDTEGRDTLLCYSKVPMPDMIARFRSDADLAFTATAPDDVRWLLARARALEAGLSAVHDAANEALAEVGQCPDYETAMVAASKLAGTLRFIADHSARAALAGATPPPPNP